MEKIMIDLGMHTNCKVSCGKNKKIFKTSERKCHGEFQPFSDTVRLGTSTRRRLESLLLPNRANVAQMTHTGRVTSRLFNWGTLIYIFKTLSTI